MSLSTVKTFEAITYAMSAIAMRDEFAKAAMQGYMSTYPCQAVDDQDGGKVIDPDAVAGDAYEMADAMMKARTA